MQPSEVPSQPLRESSLVTHKRRFVLDPDNLYVRMRRAQQEKRPLRFSPDDLRLRIPIWETVTTHLPKPVAQQNGRLSLTFADLFALSREEAQQQPIPALEGFTAEWSMPGLVRVQLRLPTEQEISQYYGTEQEKIPFSSSFGGFHLAYGVAHHGNGYHEFITDLNWLRESEQALIAECLFDNEPEIALAYREPGEKHWQAGKLLNRKQEVSSLNLDNLNQVAFPVPQIPGHDL